MSRRYEVRFTDEARDDLLRLHAFLAEHSPRVAEEALGTIRRALTLLEEFPWSCRASTALVGRRFRELVISFGAAGYVALFEIEEDTVTVLAVRHQRESDFH